MFSTLVFSAAAAHLGGFGIGFGILFFIVPLFFIGLLLLAGGLARRRWGRAGFRPGGAAHFGHGYGYNRPGRGAESTLAERFAQGDIDEKEYRARLEVLRTNDGATPPVA